MEDRLVAIPEEQTKEQTKVTVWLDEGSSGTLKVFRCIVCGHVVFEYYNNIRMIVTGEAGYLQSPTVQQCRGRVRVVTPTGEQYSASCKARYQIQ